MHFLNRRRSQAVRQEAATLSSSVQIRASPPFPMACDMCGKEAPTKPVLVEGVSLLVCSSCAQFGKSLSPKQLVKVHVDHQFEEPTKSIVADSSQRIKKAREARRMTQKEFAVFLTEKESTIHKLESGHPPDLELAKKLEKKLGITLTEEIKEKIIEKKKTEGSTLTIGDLLKEKLLK